MHKRFKYNEHIIRSAIRDEDEAGRQTRNRKEANCMGREVFVVARLMRWLETVPHELKKPKLACAATDEESGVE